MFSPAAYHSLLGFFLVLGISLVAGCSKTGGEADADDISKVVESLYYENSAAISQGAQSPVVQAGVVLAIARTQDRNIDPPLINQLLQAFIAKNSNASYRLVTVEDLTGTGMESALAAFKTGGVQVSAMEQQSLQFALSQGIPGVLAVSIENLNVRPAQTAQNMFIGDARGTASLLSTIDSNRVSSTDANSNTRGFNAQQVADGTLDALAAALAEKTANWNLPETAAINQAKCEIHAKIEGLTMPAFVEEDGKFVFDNQSIPLFASGANVEIDGVLVGQTPCSVTTGRGLRKLKVYRDGVKPFEAMVNLTGRDRFEITLVPTDETRSQFNGQMQLLREVQQEGEISQAGVGVLNGYAKMLRQSGFRIDQRTIKDGQKLSLDQEDRN
jgi:hypothetical protein